METILSKLTLKHVAFIAAIGTTVYTFFVPICNMLFDRTFLWLYAEHPWLYQAWYRFFSCVLMVSWAVFALGMIRDGAHFPILGKRLRYAVLAFAIIFCLYILCNFYVSIIYVHGKWMIRTDLWFYLFFLSVCDVVLWYIYIHPYNPDPHPHLPRWQKGLCWVTIVLTLLVVVITMVAVLWYAQRVSMQSGTLLYPREMYYTACCIYNWLMYCIPIVFFLLIFFQPAIQKSSNSQLPENISQK